MDPRLSALVDCHSRRFGAPTELVAILGPDRSHVVVDGFDRSWIDAIPTDRLSLVGQLGGMVIERCDADMSVTVALAGGRVHRWCGQPGTLEAIATNSADDVATVALLWRVLDPQASVPRGSIETVFAEIAGRALLCDIVGCAVTDGDVEVLDAAVAAFATGSLASLARLGGAPRPPSTPNASYVRDLLVLSGHRRIPLPAGGSNRNDAALHRAVPYRWQIAADLTEVLGRGDAGKLIMACEPRWIS
jgi:hypothetical protein